MADLCSYIQHADHEVFAADTLLTADGEPAIYCIYAAVAAQHATVSPHGLNSTQQAATTCQVAATSNYSSACWQQPIHAAAGATLGCAPPAQAGVAQQP